jgi:hypothetical protein
MNALRDALLRAFGARAGTFVPVARAYGLMARRRSRLRMERASKGKALSWLTPFQITCLMTCFLGFYVVHALLDRSEIPSGSVLAATLGFAFIGSISLFDYFDLLFSADEYRVLGAHPHHPWSVMLAKIVVIGRAVTTLSLCFFLPGMITIGLVTRDAALVAAFGAGTLLGSIATGVGAVVLGASILSAGGRSALLRLLPWVQTGYLVLYFGVIAGREPILGAVRHAMDGAGILLWLLPSAWFVAPVEWVVNGADPGTAARAALAVGSLFAVAAVGSRAVGSGFGERLRFGRDEGPGRSGTGDTSRRRARLHAARPASLTRDPAARAFARLASAHARTDLAFRGQLVMAVVWPLLLFGSQAVGGLGPGVKRPADIALLSFAVPLAIGFWGANAAFTISGKSAAIARVLATPVDRVRFAFAPVSLLRRWALAPALAAIGAWYLATAPAGGLGFRAAQWAGLAILADTQLFVNRGVTPEFPFSASLNRGRRLEWAQVLALLLGLMFTGGGIGLLMISWRTGAWGIFAGLAVLGLLRYLSGRWARARVSRAAASLEAG